MTTTNEDGQFYGAVILISDDVHERVRIIGAATKATSKDAAHQGAMEAGAVEAHKAGWGNAPIRVRVSGPYGHPNTALRAAKDYAAEVAMMHEPGTPPLQVDTGMLYESDVKS